IAKSLTVIRIAPNHSRKRHRCVTILVMPSVALVTIFLVASAGTGNLTIHVPAEQKVVAAKATSGADTITGKIASDEIHFEKLQPGAKYDIAIESSDGHVDQGVESDWYSDEAPDPKTAAMDDDDRQQMQSILKDIKSF